MRCEVGGFKLGPGPTEAPGIAEAEETASGRITWLPSTAAVPVLGMRSGGDWEGRRLSGGGASLPVAADGSEVGPPLSVHLDRARPCSSTGGVA